MNNPSRHSHNLRIALMMMLAHGEISWAAAQDNVESDEQFFTQKIEPILKKHCLVCHSHATGEMEGGLTLDSASGWREGGSRGPAIVPENPDESLLIKVVRRTDPELSMPPDEKLSEGEIRLLTEWINRGAADPRTLRSVRADDPRDWWSLRPLLQPQLPDSDVAEGETHPVDAFINHRLRAEELLPTSQADRRTLIRRVTFDLHGMQPTPEEVDSFVADKDSHAYRNLVDRLLASPRYGERWARHWLDSVHFADSHGCEHDVFRPNAWRYRDYVINAFNTDTPWPEFIREQLAADHFFPEETHLIAGLGFIAAGPLELSRAGTAPVTFDYLDRDDMVTQTMAAFVSTTANCARCHDHKFDPVTQEDYYSLQAVFAGIGKGDVEFDVDPAVAKQRHKWSKLLDQATSGVLQRKSASEEIINIARQWEEELSDKSAVWMPLRPAAFASFEGATLKRLEDDSVLAVGHLPESDTYTISAPLSLDRMTALRLEVLPDESLPVKGPGRAANGNLHLSEIEIFLSDSESRRLKIVGAVADWDQEGWTIAHSLDENVKTAWGIYPKVGEAHHAVFEFAEPAALKADSQVTVVLKQLHGGSHLIGRFRLHVTAADSATAKVYPRAVTEALQVEQSQRTPAQQDAILPHAVKSFAERQLTALPEPATVYAVSDRYSRAKKLQQPMTPRVVHVLKRGNIEQPGEVAAPGSLSVITELPGRFMLSDAADEVLRRAALADWLAAPENPLTWRSVVNRVWAYHFGQGLCDTPNDFGRMGGLPSHPKLLDWLAVWFRDDARGSIKQLHRLILLSDAYQRSSSYDELELHDTRRSHTHDKDNRLLWRSSRRRMDAESFRDSVLRISGRLDLTMGGSGIQQFTQSKGQQSTPKLDYDAFDWHAAGAARRSIYRVVWRGIADPFMESLDFPDLGLLAPKRDFSVSALQSLAMYNNDFVLHHSQVLADELANNHATAEEQITQAVRFAYLREPSQKELVLLAAYTQQYGLAATCRVLFNSNDFLFIN